MSETNSSIDSDLIRRIHLAVKRSPHINSGHVNFQAANGRVLIRGLAISYYEKQMAQEALRSIDGISAIENEIEVCL